jgi:hypothetical protein
MTSQVTGAVTIFVVGDKTGIDVGTFFCMAGACPSNTPAVRLVVIVFFFFLTTIYCWPQFKNKIKRLENCDVFSSIGEHALNLVMRLSLALHCCQLYSFVRGHNNPPIDSMYHNIIVMVHHKSVILFLFNH